jgi:DNA-3-methyladenine glycosylase
MNHIIPKKFFKRPVLEVSRDLIGKFLVYKKDNKTLALQIIEIEAYDGPFDLASHARFGKTDRNSAMFCAGGVFYLYFIYGMYWMLNIVVGQEGYPAAILIRSAGHLHGPGKLTNKLGLDSHFNEKEVSKQSSLWIEDRGHIINKQDILQSARTGISYAGSKWSYKPYRFYLNTKTPTKKKANITVAHSF